MGARSSRERALVALRLHGDHQLLDMHEDPPDTEHMHDVIENILFVISVLFAAAIDPLRDELLSPAQIARRFGIHPSAPWRWMTRGVRGVFLDHVVVGRRYMTSPQALHEFIRQRTDAERQAREEPNPIANSALPSPRPSDRDIEEQLDAEGL